MTDRYHAFTVVLEEDIRCDDGEPILNALRQIRGVISVKPHVTGVADHDARERVRHEFAKKLWDVLYPPKGR